MSHQTKQLRKYLRKEIGKPNQKRLNMISLSTQKRIPTNNFREQNKNNYTLVKNNLRIISKETPRIIENPHSNCVELNYNSFFSVISGYGNSGNKYETIKFHMNPFSLNLYVNQHASSINAKKSEIDKPIIHNSLNPWFLTCYFSNKDSLIPKKYIHDQSSLELLAYLYVGQIESEKILEPLQVFDPEEMRYNKFRNRTEEIIAKALRK